MVLGVLGAVAQRQLVEIGAKTKRGQLGRVRQGKIPGGLAYGYEVVPPPPGAKESGDRRIVEHEAMTVRRIFEAFAHGSSPRALARKLNDEGVLGPGGRPWGDTTIRGQLDRGTGILNNTLYVGQLSWDRCQYLKDPSTGKRVARPVPKDKWEIQAVEHLRIIPQDVWDKVKARQMQVRIEIGRDASGNALNRAHRQAFLFSGTLVCGCCGGAYAILQTNRYGCSHRRAKGTCDNALLVDRPRIEARILTGLKDRLLSPDLVAEFVREFASAQREQSKEAAIEHRRLKILCDDVERKLSGIIKAIENGAWSDTLNNRLTALEREKATLKVAMDASEDPSPVVLHPNAAELYRQKVEDLQSALNDPTIKSAAMEALRALFEKIVLTPDVTQPDGVRVELHGALAAILRLGEHRNAGKSGDLPAFDGDLPQGRLSVVAGIGFEPMTFRL